MIKAIFFDMGGVICEEGFKPAPKVYEKEFGVPADIFYAAIHDHQAWKDFTLGKVSEDEYLKICREHLSFKYEFNGKRYVEIVNELTRPNEKLIKLIKEKLAKKFIIGIVSNHPKEWFERFLKKTELSDIIQIRAVSGYEHVRKPSMEIFKVALNKAKVKSEEAVYIDDREEMFGEAQRLGIKTIVFSGSVAELTNKIKSMTKVTWYAIARRKGAFLERDVFIRYLCLKKTTLDAPDYGFKISRYKYIDWAHYYDKNEFEKITESINKRVLKIGNFNKFYGYRKQKNEESKEIMEKINKDLWKSSNVDLIKQFKQYVEIRGTTICALLVGNYIVRGLSNLAERTVKKNLKKLSSEEFKKILIELSFSEKESAFCRREKELLHIAEEINGNGFLGDKLSGLSSDMKKKISQFRDKYDWANSMFLFRKEVKDNDIFNEVLAAIKDDPTKKLKNMAEERVLASKRKRLLIKKFNLNKQSIRILDLLAESSFLETELVRFFQLTDYYGYPLLCAVGKRFGLSFEEVVFLSISEIINGLKGNKLPAKSVLRERDNMFGFYYESRTNTFKSFCGKEVDKYRETHVDSSLKEVKGVVASRGKVTGRVRVILETSRVPEMQDGEILVTMMTTPSFVVAMKKAAAIVTSDGGITCHAAIISRELNKPCVIGTKIATQVFKTGDLVEVDAEDGVVRKLS